MGNCQLHVPECNTAVQRACTEPMPGSENSHASIERKEVIEPMYISSQICAVQVENSVSNRREMQSDLGEEDCSRTLRELMSILTVIGDDDDSTRHYPDVGSSFEMGCP